MFEYFRALGDRLHLDGVLLFLLTIGLALALITP